MDVGCLTASQGLGGLSDGLPWLVSGPRVGIQAVVCIAGDVVCPVRVDVKRVGTSRLWGSEIREANIGGGLRPNLVWRKKAHLGHSLAREQAHQERRGREQGHRCGNSELCSLHPQRFSGQHRLYYLHCSWLLAT